MIAVFCRPVVLPIQLQNSLYAEQLGHDFLILYRLRYNNGKGRAAEWEKEQLSTFTDDQIRVSCVRFVARAAVLPDADSAVSAAAQLRSSAGAGLTAVTNHAEVCC